MTGVLVDTLLTGLPFVPAYLGIFMVLRLRQDFDLTVEGSFALGGGVCAVALTGGVGPWFALVLALVAGGLAGLVTAVINLTLDVPVVLAGLVTSIGLFSVTLRVTNLPTISLLGVDTIFAPFTDGRGTTADIVTIAIQLLIVLVVLLGFAAFLLTELGLALRASGVNEAVVRSQGASNRRLLVLSLVLSNALGALGAGLVVQTQGYADVNMGVGVFVSGVGAVLLGSLLLRPSGSRVLRMIAAVLVGALVYRLILVIALRIGVPANDLKGVTALTLIIAVAAQRYLSLGFEQLSRRRTPNPLLEVSA